MARAFDGLRVVEFAQVISGPMAATLLGFLGADVIKVETPGTGDQARAMMDGGPLAGTGMSPLFQGLNTGKRSLALNLKHPRAADVVRRLVERADVVVENLRPGVMTGLGFSYDALRAIRPDLVYCSISGYGQTGPKQAAPAYDGAVQAASGMMSINGAPGGGPVRVGWPVVDVAAAMTAAYAIASALYRRTQTGEGQYLDVGMLDAALSLMSPVVNGYLVTGDPPAQLGNLSVTRQPTADVYHTADGYIQMTALTTPQLRALWSAIGRPELAGDPRQASIEAQVANAAWIRGQVAHALLDAPTDAWIRRLESAGVPCARVLTIPEALADAQVAHRTILARVAGDPPEGVASTVVNAGFRAVPDGPQASMPPPVVGANTDAVLAELGYTPAEVAAFRADGVT